MIANVWAIYALWNEPKEWQLNVYRALLGLDLLGNALIFPVSPMASIIGLILSSLLMWWTFEMDLMDRRKVWIFNMVVVIVRIATVVVAGGMLIPLLVLRKRLWKK